MFRISLSAAALTAFATPLMAEVPAVATDIAPVHALVAQVMEGVGSPELIVPPRASPHGYAMRPSEARALSGADLVVWVGPALTPWLAEPITTLAGEAGQLALIEIPETQVLGFREGAAFGAHAHEDADGSNDHAAEAPSDGGDDAAHGPIDPHAWLDPRNGQLWLGHIAEALAELNPENAVQYRANAKAGQAALVDLEAEITEMLAPVKDRPFIVFHDAYHYFEARFESEALGAISENDARSPGAARVAELRAVVQDSGAKCVFAEPQFNPGLTAAVTEGQGTKLGTLDPIGVELEPGAGLYAALLREMAQSMAECLSG